MNVQGRVAPETFPEKRGLVGVIHGFQCLGSRGKAWTLQGMDCTKAECVSRNGDARGGHEGEVAVPVCVEMVRAQEWGNGKVATSLEVMQSVSASTAWGRCPCGPPGFPECEWGCFPVSGQVFVRVLGLSTPRAGMDPAHKPQLFWIT